MDIINIAISIAIICALLLTVLVPILFAPTNQDIENAYNKWDAYMRGKN